jgi:hypothetical protein
MKSFNLHGKAMTYNEYESMTAEELTTLFREYAVFGNMFSPHVILAFDLRQTKELETS